VPRFGKAPCRYGWVGSAADAAEVELEAVCAVVDAVAGSAPTTRPEHMVAVTTAMPRALRNVRVGKVFPSRCEELTRVSVFEVSR